MAKSLPDRPLSAREHKLLEALATEPTQVAAAQASGYSPQSVSRKVRTDVSFREMLRTRLEEMGFGPAGTAAKLAELLHARQAGLTKDGQVVDMGPDAHAQNKAMDMVLKVTGSYPDPRLDINHQLAAQIVILGADTLPGGDVLTDEYIDAEYDVQDMTDSV